MADVVLAAGLAQLVIMRTVADVSAAVTGPDARIWAVVLAVGLAGGGYRVAELGADDPVSRGERAALATLAAWADRRVRLDGDPEPPDI